MMQTLNRIRLFAAVKRNRLSEIQKLANNGVDLSIKDKKGRSLLALAYHYNSTDLIEFLRSSGIREEINRLYNYAKRCLNTNNLEEARKRFEELTKFFPTDSAVFYYLACANYKIAKADKNEHGNLEGANLEWNNSVDNITTSLALNENDYRLDPFKLANANYLLSLFYYRSKKYKEAIHYSTIALENVNDHEGAKEILEKTTSRSNQ